MLKVAMVVWNDFRNDARVLKEAESLQLSGYAVTVFALHIPGVTPQRERLKSGIEVVRVALNPFGACFRKWTGNAVKARRVKPQNKLVMIASRLWAHVELMWRMKQLKADVVHSHDVNTLPTAWIAAKLSGAKMIYDAHEISSSREGYSAFSKLVSWLEAGLMPRVQGAITTTEIRAKFFARMYGVKRPVVLQNRPRSQVLMTSNRLREELDLEEGRPIVVYQGGLQPGRGLEGLVRAAEKVSNAYFVFIGSGLLEVTLKDLAIDLGLRERVHFIPTVPLDQLPSYTASADVGVQPIENTCLNHYSTDSNKLFEYVQAGLPVVASDLPEIRRVVKEYNLGKLVSPGNAEELEFALIKMVEDAEIRRYYAENSSAASEKLTWEEQEHKLLDLYAAVIGQR